MGLYRDNIKCSIYQVYLSEEPLPRIIYLLLS